MKVAVANHRNKMFPFNLINLTHVLNPNIPSWNGNCGFTLTTALNYIDCTTQTKFHVQSITMENGIGTHMDAPAHCIPGGKTIDQYTPQELLLACHMIDLSHTQPSAEYLISKNDVTEYETTHGPITEKSFVLFHTGWSAHCNNPERYRNNLQFPTLSIEAAQYLVSKSISGVGIDTLSVDLPEAFNADLSAHTVLLEHGIFIIENVANGNLMSATDNYILIAPLNIQGATESPVRLIGMIKQ